MFLVGRFFRAGLLLAIGIAFFLIGRLILANPTVPPEFEGKTKATITQLERYTSTSGGKTTTSYHVTVAFTVDGREYGGLLNGYDITMKQGKEIDLIYDTRSPSIFTTPGSDKLMGRVLMGLGIVAALMSPAALLGFGRSRWRRFGLLR